MSHIHVKSEQVVDAPPEEVYAALKDYKHKRPKILTPNFLGYQVKRGGVGSGTEVDYRLKAAGRERPYHMQVNETIKGKVLTERDSNSSLITRWTLLPVKGGKKTQVSLSSEWEGGRGVGGFFERAFAPMGLRRIYGSMLDTLARSMQTEHKDMQAGEEPGNIASDAAKFTLLVGLVFGVAIGMGYLQKRKEEMSCIR
jgi:Polyketide cyclase / dehydrase and lipid transport